MNVVEGIIDDLKKGHIPNIFAEKGWKAEWKHNRKGAIKKITIITTVLVVAFLLSKKSRAKKR